MTNEEGLVQNIRYHPPIGNSDHVVIHFELACYAEVCVNRARLNFNKGDYTKLNNLIKDTNWAVFDAPDIQQQYEAFASTLTDLVDICVPRAYPKGRRRNIYINREALRLKKKKGKLWSAYISSRDDLSYARYVRCRNDLRRLTRKLRRDFELTLTDKLKENPKGFWSYANSRLKSRSVVENLRTPDGGLTTSDEQKATVLNQFFSSVCTTEDDTRAPAAAEVYTGPPLEDVAITAATVKQKLTELRPTAAAGPDGIHPRILRETADALSPILAHMFRGSLDAGIVPRNWKLADVVPIYKKGDKDDPGNYRPVSLTSVPCKVLESIIRDELMRHLQEEGLFADAQHGFRPGRSCATQLLLAIEEWSSSVERGDPVDVIYLDLAKAFNTVPPKRLLLKLKTFGIGGKILRWLEAFLVERLQRVSVGGCHSGWLSLTSGVPQGSVLAPLLFILYVNDLPETVDCSIKIFADDCKLYLPVSLPSGPLVLQRALDSAVCWADEWQLSFNTAKSKVLHIGRLLHHQKYTMSGAIIEETSTEKDLGVHVDSDLKFRKQAATAVSKASQVMAVIRKSFQLIDKKTLPLLFKTLVRPHLEYGNIVWGPFNRADQRRVEGVQRRATKLVPELRNLPYPERLQALNLPSLYYRRRRGDMIAVYQMLHGGFDLDQSIFFNTTHVRDTRGHPLRLVKPHAVTRIRRNAFSVRVVNDWNSLPGSVVTSDTLNQFKNRLDAHWSHIEHTIPYADG